MTKRGEIVKEPLAGPGLLLVDGKHYPFTLEGDWRSQATPRIGMVVDVFLHPQAGVVAVQPTVHSTPAKLVPTLPARPPAPPPAPQFSSTPMHRPAPVKRVATGSPLKAAILDLVALAALIFGWFVLPSIRFGGLISAGFTFWQLLRHVGDLQSLSGSGSSLSTNGGLISLLAPVAMIGPFIFFFWKNRYAALGGLLPFGLTLFVGFWVWNSIHRAVTAADEAASSIFGSILGDAVSNSALNMFHIEVGVYLSAIACVYFALIALRRLVNFPS